MREGVEREGETREGGKWGENEGRGGVLMLFLRDQGEGHINPPLMAS